MLKLLAWAGIACGSIVSVICLIRLAAIRRERLDNRSDARNHLLSRLSAGLWLDLAGLLLLQSSTKSHTILTVAQVAFVALLVADIAGFIWSRIRSRTGRGASGDTNEG